MQRSLSAARRPRLLLSVWTSSARISCTSVSTEITLSTQVCRPGTREAVAYCDEPVQVDVNADMREQAVASYTADLCL